MMTGVWSSRFWALPRPINFRESLIKAFTFTPVWFDENHPLSNRQFNFETFRNDFVTERVPTRGAPTTLNSTLVVDPISMICSKAFPPINVLLNFLQKITGLGSAQKRLLWHNKP